MIHNFWVQCDFIFIPHCVIMRLHKDKNQFMLLNTVANHNSVKRLVH